MRRGREMNRRLEMRRKHDRHSHQEHPHLEMVRNTPTRLSLRTLKYSPFWAKLMPDPRLDCSYFLLGLELSNPNLKRKKNNSLVVLATIK